MFIPGDNEITLPSGTVKYRYKPSNTDRRRVLLVFSGFRPKGTLDFAGGGFAPIREDIIWIYDEFGETKNNTYYLRDSGDNYPERLVEEFVDTLTDWFNIPRSMVIATGFSKGGTAALYHSTKLGLGACVSTVPQFNIGDYVEEFWPAVATSMCGESLSINDLNQLLPQHLAQHANPKVPVYLLTSIYDDQYETEIQPNLHRLQSFDNLNVLEINSALVTEHVEVTPYAVPIVQALLLLLLDGITPRLGTQYVEDYADPTSPAGTHAHGTPEAIVSLLELKNNKLNIELDAFIRGLALPDHGIMDRSVQIGTFRTPLGSLLDHTSTLRHNRWETIDYNAAKTTTVRRQGISTSDIPTGTNHITIHMSERNGSRQASTPLRSTGLRWGAEFMDGHMFRFASSQTETVIQKFATKDIEVVPAGRYNKVDELSIDGNALKIRGRLAPTGASLQNWGDAIIRLIAVDQNNDSYAFPLGALHRPADLPPSLAKSYYCDLGQQGVNLEHLPYGEYEILVVIATKDVLASSGVLAKVEKDIRSLTILEQYS